EPAQERLIAGVLLLQDFDRDDAAEDCVFGLPHFAHASDGDALCELIALAHRDADSRSHSSITASSILSIWDRVSSLPVPMSIPSYTTVTAYCGSSAGANPVIQELTVLSSSSPRSAVPVLAATSKRLDCAPWAVPASTVSTIMS